MPLGVHLVTFDGLLGNFTIREQRDKWMTEGCLVFDDRTKSKAGILASEWSICFLALLL